MDIGAGHEILVVEDIEGMVMSADLVIEFFSPDSDMVWGVPDFGERGWGRVEGNTFQERETFPGEWPVFPAEYFAVGKWFSFVDFAAVRVGEIYFRIEHSIGDFLEAIWGDFIVVVEFGEGISFADVAAEIFDFPDIGSFSTIGNDTNFRDDLFDIATGGEYRGNFFWGYWSIRNDDPLEILVGLLID